MFLASWATEILGVDSIFGAFVTGAITPRKGNIHEAIGHKVEALTVAVLLPLYFTFSGIRTVRALQWPRPSASLAFSCPLPPHWQSFSALNSGESWGVVFIVIACAFAGKLGGCAVAARLTGMDWRDSLVVGSLMNARGCVRGHGGGGVPALHRCLPAQARRPDRAQHRPHVRRDQRGRIHV